MLGMKNHFDISDSIEIREVDIAGVACINTDSKNSEEPQQKYRLGTVSIKILGGLNRFYRRLTSPSASIMAQNIQLLFGPRGGFLTHQWIIT